MNKIIVSKKVVFGKKVLNISMVTKMIEKLTRYVKLSAYRRDLDETKYMYF